MRFAFVNSMKMEMMCMASMRMMMCARNHRSSVFPLD